MAKELEKRYAERVKATSQRNADVPTELAALDERLARLKNRLRRGDPDIETDELSATIERVEARMVGVRRFVESMQSRGGYWFGH